MDEFNIEPKSVLKPLELFLILLVTMIIVPVIGLPITYFFGPSVGLLTEALIIFPAMVYVYIKKMHFTKTFRLNKISPSLLSATLLLAFSLFIIGDELDRLVNSLFPIPDYIFEAMKDMLTFHSIPHALLLILTGVIFAAITEEMLFRGAIMKTLEKNVKPAAAIFISSLLFAIIHFNPWSVLQILFIGLFMGYMAWKSDSIFPSMIFHALNNLASMLFLNTPEDSLRWYSGEQHVKFYWIIAAVALLIPAIRYFNSVCSEKTDSPATEFPQNA